MEGTVKVIVPPNIRVFSDPDSDVDLFSGHTFVLTPRQLRSITLRGALRDGRVRIIEGRVEFPLRGGKITVEGMPSGNTFVMITDADGTQKKHVFDTPASKMNETTRRVEKHLSPVVKPSPEPDEPTKPEPPPAPEFTLDNILKKKHKK